MNSASAVDAMAQPQVLRRAQKKQTRITWRQYDPGGPYWAISSDSRGGADPLRYDSEWDDQAIRATSQPLPLFSSFIVRSARMTCRCRLWTSPYGELAVAR